MSEPSRAVDRPRRRGVSAGVSARACERHEARGLGEAELLEVLTVIATYRLATAANNLARTRIDPEYRLDR